MLSTGGTARQGRGNNSGGRTIPFEDGPVVEVYPSVLSCPAEIAIIVAALREQVI